MWRSSSDRWTWPSLTARASYVRSALAAAADADLALVGHGAAVLDLVGALGAPAGGVEGVHALGVVGQADVGAGRPDLRRDEELAGGGLLDAQHVAAGGAELLV